MREALRRGAGDPWVPAPTHSLDRQEIVEHLLCARHRSRGQGDSGDELDKVPALRGLHPAGKMGNKQANKS